MVTRTNRSDLLEQGRQLEASAERDQGVAATYHALCGLRDKIHADGPWRATEEARLFRRMAPDYKFEMDYTKMREEIRILLTRLDLLDSVGGFKPRGN